MLSAGALPPPPAVLPLVDVGGWAKAMGDSKRTITPEVAAHLVGLPVDKLLELAGEGQVFGSRLAAFGWRFSLEGIRQLADRLALSGSDDDGGRVA
jgi:hypothetical protein